MIPATIIVITYVIIPAFAGYIVWFIKTFKPTTSVMIPILVTTLFWSAGIIFGFRALEAGVDQSKGFYAISAAAITMSLTTFGEMFNSFPGDGDETKVAKTKIKSGITILRALLIFVLTAIYFYH
ncbi:hypothetical protein V2J79_14100 [Pseudomonas alliivorans]|nr:hypothetical protein [Pseudomonas alliivorans]